MKRIEDAGDVERSPMTKLSAQNVISNRRLIVARLQGGMVNRRDDGKVKLFRSPTCRREAVCSALETRT